MPQLVLHQFPISHYCEKIRWVLDYKRLPYQVKNQFPGLHAPANRRLVGRRTVPVLVDGHHAVGDSSDIALYLDDQFPDVRLIPGVGEERARVLELEAHFDERVGPAVRRWIYGLLIPRPQLFKQVLFGDYDQIGRLLGAVAGGLVAKRIAAMYGIGPGSGEASLSAIDAAFARLEQLIEGDPERYLVGDALSLADVTAASLLAPVIGPPDSVYAQELDLPEVSALRASSRKRAGGRWVLARYARDRHPRN